MLYICISFCLLAHESQGETKRSCVKSYTNSQIVYYFNSKWWFFQFYVPLPRFSRLIQLSSASWYVLIWLYKCRKKHKGLLYEKSIYWSHARSHFYGTNFGNWADFGPVSSTEKKNWANYEQFLRPIYLMLKNLQKHCSICTKSCIIYSIRIVFLIYIFFFWHKID